MFRAAGAGVLTAALALSALALAQDAAPATAPITASAPADESRRETDEGWFAVPAVRDDKPARPVNAERTFVIPIREQITPKTFQALRRKGNASLEQNAELIIFDMDTFGGQVIAALDIARYIKTDLNDVYTVCYVHTRAISAGALIALACDEIVMTPVGKIGDCAPIVAMAKLEGVEREKGESPLRVEFVESAERNGYPPALAESMVTITREVWLVRNKATRELRYVLRKDFSGKVSAPAGITSAPADPDAEWELLRVEVNGSELLTMTTAKAKEYGFVSEIVDAPTGAPLSELQRHLGLEAPAVVMVDNWSEKLVHFLTSAPVVSFLVFVALLCAYVEMHTPGFGVAGGVAIAFFALLFGSHYLVGMATWWEIALFFIGIVLLAAEIFVTPGFGVLGIAGILCCIVGLTGMIIENAPNELPVPQTETDWSILYTGIKAILIGFLMAVFAAVLLAKYLPDIPIANRLFLAAPNIEPVAPASEQSAIARIRAGALGLSLIHI